MLDIFVNVARSSARQCHDRASSHTACPELVLIRGRQIHRISLLFCSRSLVRSCCTIVRAENSAVRLQSNFNRKLELQGPYQKHGTSSGYSHPHPHETTSKLAHPHVISTPTPTSIPTHIVRLFTTTAPTWKVHVGMVLGDSYPPHAYPVTRGKIDTH